jgi:3-deoxy-7-phosphoheptulonate synthase
MPIGIKNGTDGNIQVAVDAMESARHPHSFLGIDEGGQIAIVRTCGTEWGHLILRGGKSGSNYDAASIQDACQRMSARSLRPVIMVDCSHGNTDKKFAAQEQVWNDALAQRAAGNRALIGMLVESNLFEGSQPLSTNLAELRYGVSVTDACIGWETTERMLRDVKREM